MIKTASRIIPQLRMTRTSEATPIPQRTSLIHWVALVMAVLSVGSAANAAPQLIDITIVEIAGRPGHQGFFPIQGDPIVGTNAVARARLIGQATGLTLVIRNTFGQTLLQVPLTAPPDDVMLSDTYYANITVPTAPFTMSVIGTDAGGNFEVAPDGNPAISPRTLALQLIPTAGEVAEGQPYYFFAQATNFGASDTFTVTVTSTESGVVQPATAPVQMSTGETQGIQFQLNVPVPTAPSIAPTVTLTAQGVGTLAAGIAINSAVLQLPITLTAAQPLSAWVHPDEDHDLTKRRPPAAINVWVCDTGVVGGSLNVADMVSPTSVQSGPVAPRDRGNCNTPSAIQLTYSTADIISVLSARGLAPQKNRDTQIPIAGVSTTGAPLVGYFPLKF